MAAHILTNLASYVFGVPTAESGMNVESVDVESKCTEIKVPDHFGNTCGIVQHDFEQVYKVKGFLVGAPATKPGDIITVANAIVTIGVVATEIIVSDVQIGYKSKALATISYTATARGGIPTASTQVSV